MKPNRKLRLILAVMILGAFGFGLAPYARAQSDDSTPQNPPVKHPVSHHAKHKFKKRKKKKSFTKIRVDHSTPQEQENVSEQNIVSDQADSKGSKKGR